MTYGHLYNLGLLCCWICSINNHISGRGVPRAIALPARVCVVVDPPPHDLTWVELLLHRNWEPSGIPQPQIMFCYLTVHQRGKINITFQNLLQSTLQCKWRFSDKLHFYDWMNGTHSASHKLCHVNFKLLRKNFLHTAVIKTRNYCRQLDHTNQARCMESSS